MRFHDARSAARCAVCHGDLDGVGVACAGCRAEAHLDCWTDLGRCTSLGCGVPARPRIVVPPTSPAARRRLPVGLLVASLALVGALGVVVWINLQGQSVRSRSTRVQADMKAILDAADLFKVDTGAYPDSIEALWIRPANARRWGPEPYLKEYPPKDPWGNEYQYNRASGGRPEITSYGADGSSGGTEEGTDLSSKTINNQETQ